MTTLRVVPDDFQEEYPAWDGSTYYVFVSQICNDCMIIRMNGDDEPVAWRVGNSVYAHSLAKSLSAQATSENVAPFIHYLWDRKEDKITEDC